MRTKANPTALEARTARTRRLIKGFRTQGYHGKDLAFKSKSRCVEQRLF